VVSFAPEREREREREREGGRQKKFGAKCGITTKITSPELLQFDIVNGKCHVERRAADRAEIACLENFRQSRRYSEGSIFIATFLTPKHANGERPFVSVSRRALSLHANKGCQIFLGTTYQSGKNTPNELGHMAMNIPNGRKIHQMDKNIPTSSIARP
jgi:hypothetical protein